jgi:hypothetical protein
MTQLSQLQRNALAYFSVEPTQRRFSDRPIRLSTGTIESLVRRGLLTRIPNPDHPKATVLVLTPAGKEELLPAVDVVMERGRLVGGTMNYGVEYELDGRRYLVFWDNQVRRYVMGRELPPGEWDGAWAP